MTDSPWTDEDRDASIDDLTLEPTPTGARAFRRLLAGSVVALTTAVHEEFRGVTVSAFMNVSISPPLFLASVDCGSQMDDWLRASAVFAASLLTRRQQFLADQLAGRAPLVADSFRAVPHFMAITGSPILAHCIAWVDCRIVQEVVVGDHRLFVGEAVAMGKGEGSGEDALVYYLNRYRRIE
jgi:flavin reductase (DIM6/NTAB) family NADH-FMN oxidoreductase RutF